MAASPFHGTGNTTSSFAFVRPHKVAGSFLASLCYRQCAVRCRIGAMAIGGSSCCAWCYAAFDTHFDFSMWASVNAWLSERGRTPVKLFTMLRSPVARVQSEYTYAVARLSAGVGSVRAVV